MRWSELRHRTEALFTPSVKGRVTVHSTRYGGCSCGRGWIVVDKREVADFNSLLAWRHYERPGTRPGMWADWTTFVAEPRTDGTLAEPGEFTRFELHDACWEFVHANAHACLKSQNPLVRTLAVLHARVGKAPIRKLLETETHPLVRALAEFRLQAEVEALTA